MSMNPKIYRKFDSLESVIFSVFVSERLEVASEATTYSL